LDEACNARVEEAIRACNREGVASPRSPNKGTFSLPSALAIFGKRFGDAF
jgi:hypothetical protein